MKKLLLLLILPVISWAEPLEFFLPKGDMYNATLPSPDTYLGQHLGDRHLRHDQLVSYFKFLSAGSDQAQLVQYGETNEGRPLLLMAISSKNNIANLDQVKKDPKTTGHSWDGIEEFDNPMPRWWLWTLYACIVWAIGYSIAYPAWPGIKSATAGVLGYSTRGEVAKDIAAAMDRLLVEDIGPEQLLKDEVLNLLGDLSGHWQNSLRLFARVHNTLAKDKESEDR